jgi:serine phosphatase RsbU (regulator of sigma subunit)
MGEEGMILAAEQTLDETAENIVKAIFAAADIFARNASQHDDMTVLVMRCSGTG